MSRTTKTWCSSYLLLHEAFLIGLFNPFGLDMVLLDMFYESLISLKI